MLSGFDETFCALDGQLGDAGVTLDVAVVRTRHKFRLRTGAPEICHFFRAFVDEENDQLHLRMIFHDRVGDVMEQCGLAGARRRDNQTALAHPERRHQIHDPRRITVGDRLELDLPVRIDRGQLFERAQALILRGILGVDREELD